MNKVFIVLNIFSNLVDNRREREKENDFLHFLVNNVCEKINHGI